MLSVLADIRSFIRLIDCSGRLLQIIHRQGKLYPVRRFILLMSVLFVGCIFQSPDARGEGFLTYDCSDDYAQYARIISEMNSQALSSSGHDNQSSIKRNDQPSDPWGVLCKTDGRNLELETEGLLAAVSGPKHCYTLYYDSIEHAEAAAAHYLTMPGICYAEIDCEVFSSSQAAESDFEYSFHSWGAEKMNFAPYLKHTRDWGNGTAIVAIIDSGVSEHSKLTQKLLPSGYDYVDADVDATNDLFGHGTHVAGIIADCTQDVPVFLYPIRVLNAAGSGKMSNVVNAVMEAIQRGVDIINLSLESHVMSDALDTAILEALDEGIVIVISAGNSSCDTADICPSHLKNPGIIVVGAAESDGERFVRADYSNYGASVDLYAFGTDIVSCSISGGYVKKTGTSMAAPHISALCAMLRLLHPDISPASIETRARQAAGLGDGVFAPDLFSMIPDSLGIKLQRLYLVKGESFSLPQIALPFTSQEVIRYTCLSPDIISINAGTLTAEKAGTAAVQASCLGVEEAEFEVIVQEAETDAGLLLPASLKKIDLEAFLGNDAFEYAVLPKGLESIEDHAFDDCGKLRWIYLPDTLGHIGTNSFSGAALICEGPGFSMHFAMENNLPFILAGDGQPPRQQEQP